MEPTRHLARVDISPKAVQTVWMTSWLRLACVAVLAAGCGSKEIIDVPVTPVGDSGGDAGAGGDQVIGDPTAGDPEWEGEYLCLSGNIVNSAGKFVHACTFKPGAGQADPAWGTV